MNYLDIFVIISFLLSVLIGIYRGFVKEVFSLVSWLVAFILAGHLGTSLLAYVPIDVVGDPQSKLNFFLAFAICFILCLFAFALLANFIKQLIKKINLGGLDITLGAIFGFLRWFVVLLVLTFCIQRLALTDSAWWRNAQSTKWLETVLGYTVNRLFPTAYNVNFNLANPLQKSTKAKVTTTPQPSPESRPAPDMVEYLVKQYRQQQSNHATD